MIDFTLNGVHFWENLKLRNKKLKFHTLHWYNLSAGLGGTMEISEEMIRKAKFDWREYLVGDAIRACEKYELEHP